MKFKPPKIYFDDDADLNIIRSKKVGIIGYGNQGRAQALNLHDSGIDLRIAYRDNKSSNQKILTDGLLPKHISDIIKWADVIVILVPDQVMAEVFQNWIKDNLISGKTLIFAHGYNIHYNLIRPPDNIDVIMVAPAGAGAVLRAKYLGGNGLPNLIAIHQDFSGHAFELALSYSKAIGGTRAGAFLSSFKEETETDLFGEQVLLTGGIPQLIRTAFATLVGAGYNPITAWFVCYYETKMIIDLFHNKGFEFLNQAISDTAEYGGYTRGNRLMNSGVKSEMKKILDEIQSGAYQKEWGNETKSGFPKLKKLRSAERNELIEEVTNYVFQKLGLKG